MRVYEHSNPESMSIRSHPWTHSTENPTHVYRDFRAEPGLIRSSLGDFRPWEAHAAVETFYRLLKWLNGPRSIFESNDCAFSGPTEHTNEGIPMLLQCSGRLMILFRDLPMNTIDTEVDSLKNEFGAMLSLTDLDFEWGAVGTTTVSMRLLQLPGPAARQRGQQLMISFWAWGDNVSQTMAHLDRTLGNIGGALRSLGASPTAP
jgi:hypothetical protein